MGAVYNKFTGANDIVGQVVKCAETLPVGKYTDFWRNETIITQEEAKTR